MEKLLIILLSFFLTSCGNEIAKTNTIPESSAIVESGEQNKNEESKIEEESMVYTELFEEYYGKAEEIMNEMSLEDKVGQIFLARYPVSKELANEEIKKYKPGGYILFGRDLKDEDKDSLNAKIKENQNNSKINMFIAVDEEGGTVTRVSYYKAFRNEKFQAPLKIYQRDGINGVLSDSKEKSDLLSSLGINMNLTPVVDIPTNTSSFMYARSMGTDSNLTSEFATKIIEQMNNDNMISCMKHFPGYGDNVDTHTGIAIDERTMDEFRTSDFKPFIAGIEANAPTVMVNHNIVNCMDKDMPASLSKSVHDILRDELNFSGIIMTDDLAMDAVKGYVDGGNAAEQAVLAGNDMIITSKLSVHVKEVLNGISNGVIDESVINTAVKRIIACKLAYGIIEE